MINTGTLVIGLKFGSIHNGKVMTVRLKHQHTIQEIVPDQQGLANCQIDIKLPCCIELECLGKNMEFDTIVDNHGTIIQDLCVEIVSVSLDGFEILLDKVQNKFLLTTDTGQQIRSCYIGFNGTMKIDLPFPTIFSQVMSWNRLTAND